MRILRYILLFFSSFILALITGAGFMWIFAEVRNEAFLTRCPLKIIPGGSICFVYIHIDRLVIIGIMMLLLWIGYYLLLSRLLRKLVQ